MITAGAFFLFLGLLVFGPKKTIEMSQTVGRALAQFRKAASQFQSQLHEEVRTHGKAVGSSRSISLREEDTVKPEFRNA
jgi:Sec-independent protein translocase protein TatA